MSARDWSRGYPVSAPYPSFWHSFQSPAHVRAVCALMGAAWDAGDDGTLTIAELGCGAGFSACMLAAGNPGWRVVGLDYNPAHIASARDLSSAARLENVRFIEADLGEMSDADAQALPEFDFVIVHGVWSWVDDEVRAGILRLIRRRLKSGGAALVTYNALPGAAGALGLVRLVRSKLTQHGDGAEGLAAARNIVQKLTDAQAAHLPRTPWGTILTDEGNGQRDGYLLHEFRTEHWRPAFFAEVADALASARCDFVGSATIDENFPQMSLTPEQHALWESSHPEERQLLFDLCVPRAFRRDVFVRGRRAAPSSALGDLWIAATTLEPGDMSVRGQAGEARLGAASVASLRAALSNGPQRIKALRAVTGGRTTEAELLAMVTASGAASPIWRFPGEGEGWKEGAAAARRLNAVVADRFARHGVGEHQVALANPATGGGLSAPPLEAAVCNLVASTQDRSPERLARALLPAGAEPPQSIVTELEDRIGALLRAREPVWRLLGAC